MKKKLLTLIIINILLLISEWNVYAQNQDNVQENILEYEAHIQDIGWQEKRYEGEIAGTTGKCLRLEAINIKVEGIENLKIRYKAHIQNIGWQDWKYDGEIAGTTGECLRLEAIQIELENTDRYSIMYRTHIQDIGWQDWKYDGEIAGTTGKCMRVEAIEIKIIEKRKNIKYQGHVQDIGWQDWKSNGEISGTEGKCLRLEAIKINIYPKEANIIYRTYVQNIGWQDWKSNGEMSGTEGQCLRLEAIQIKLNNLEKYSVEYKVHIEKIGWTDWFKDGEIAGIENSNLRLEAIQIRIVENDDNVVNEKKDSYIGVDVSKWQNKVDYDELVKSEKIDFMIARIGWYSTSTKHFNVDSQFERNYLETRKRNIPLGAYVYSYAETIEETIDEANAVIEYLKSTGQTKYELPIFFDIENDSQILLGKDKITEIAMTFCKTLENAGFKVGIYSYSYWLENYMYLDKIPKNYSIWIANFEKNNIGELPSNMNKYINVSDIWQYTNLGIVPGINGNVDMNICYTKYF